jgi:hypothetical protein
MPSAGRLFSKSVCRVLGPRLACLARAIKSLYKTPTGAPAGERPVYFVGTRAFSSSNQLRTTWISGAAAAPDGVRAAVTMPRILPSGVVSYRLGDSGPITSNNLPCGACTGFPTVNVGCVVKATATNPAGSEYKSSFPSGDQSGCLPVTEEI